MAELVAVSDAAAALPSRERRRARAGLTEGALRALQGRAKGYKVSDRDGLYAFVTPSGAITFRFDYRIRGRRETLTLGRYDASRAKLTPRAEADLDFGTTLSLAEARTLLARARRLVADGKSPARYKAETKRSARDAGNFEHHASIYFRDAKLAESTKAMRLGVYNRALKEPFGKLALDELTPKRITELCDALKREGAPSTALHARNLVQQIFRHAIGRGEQIDNPADRVRPSTIATFAPRDRVLSPEEVHRFFTAIERVETALALKLALKFLLLTLMRKGELIEAQWSWVDFERGALVVPGEHMKTGKPHVVYLSRQAQEILTKLRELAGERGRYVVSTWYHPGGPIGRSALNSVVAVTIAKIRASGREFEDFSVHDFRRTASTHLHEAGYSSDWIEKALAHTMRGVRAVYNKAEYGPQRRAMLQAWADAVDRWIAGDFAPPVYVNGGAL